jgi:hypothetical protein
MDGKIADGKAMQEISIQPKAAHLEVAPRRDMQERGDSNV